MQNHGEWMRYSKMCNQNIHDMTLWKRQQIYKSMLLDELRVILMSSRLEELVWLFTKTIVKSTTYVFSDKILECQENNSYDEISRNKD